MSQSPSVTGNDSSLQSIFDGAVKVFNEKTKGDITQHPLFAELAPCKSVNDILTVL